MNIKNLKIGITLGLESNKESIWTNGVKQNVLMLTHLLKNSKNNYEVCILNIFDVDFSTKPDYLEDVNIYNFKDKFMEMDLIISMGAQVSDEDLKKFRSSGDKKVVSYKCGNNYVTTMEQILFNQNNEPLFTEMEIDELWYVPQQDESNRGYYTTLHRTKAIVVPFIWHPKFIDQSVESIEKSFKDGSYKKDSKYVVGKTKKTIGIMEPNLNVVKFSLIPTMLVEESYRTDIGKKHIESLYITNAVKLKKDKLFTSIIKTFDLYKDKRVSAELRYQTPYMLSQFIDVLVCHQILNPLNYIYLDATYMGYPVIHNAYMCKDLGYYYDGSDTVEGGKVLNQVLTEHDKNINEYNSRNYEILKRYHADTETLVESYDLLIENLWKGKNINLKYNHKTNSYYE